MRTSVRSLVAVVLCLMGGALSGCGPTQFSDPDAFEKHVTSMQGPYTQGVDTDQASIYVRFAPADAMALSAARAYHRVKEQHQRAGAQESSATPGLANAHAAFETARKQYNQSLYFFMTIRPQKGDLIYDRLKQQGFGMYSQWLQKMLFGLQENIYLKMPSGDEVPLSLYRMERSFGMAPSRTFLLVFPTTFNGSNLRGEHVDLIVDEFGLRTGRLTFSFDLNSLSQEAELNL